MNPLASLLCCSEIQDTWRSNGFFLPPASHKLGIWVGQGCCLSSGPFSHPAFPPLLHKLHPMLSSDRPPHSVLGGYRQPLLRWVHLLGCPLFFLLLNYANFHKAPQGTFLTFLSHHHQLLPPPLPEQQK